jgi:hypothetical protein
MKLVSYLIVYVGDNLCVISGHHRTIKPGIPNICYEALGFDLAGSSDRKGILLLGQGNAASRVFIVGLVVKVQTDDH